MRYLLGYDIGSSSIKVALLDVEAGVTVATASSPDKEMQIHAPHPGFAEQDPDMWWQELINATKKLQQQFSFDSGSIAAIGISYQMHGLVCIDRNGKPLRPSIIWCDSRAVEIGDNAFDDLGKEYCLQNFLNSPGNFTASKLKWVKDNEPGIYEKIYKIMLPGDYIAFKLTGDVATTIPGLSEGVLWNFKKNKVAKELLQYYGIDENLLADIVPTFGEQGKLTQTAAQILNLEKNIPVSYRCGDQPNNAFSLNVLKPGEIAATAGTSGVVYGVSNKVNYDPKSRVNSFVHVNHRPEEPRYGVLLCVNGTGILNSWLRKNFFPTLSYPDINNEASKIIPGAEDVRFYPFGNGSERILENSEPGALMKGLQFNRHHRGHVARAAQEGIVFALNYGMSIMKNMEMEFQTIRAGHANMFLSDVFASAFANTTGCVLELYNTDGAVGAARGAGIGSGAYQNISASFTGMEKVKVVIPDKSLQSIYTDIYQSWLKDFSLLNL